LSKIGKRVRIPLWANAASEMNPFAKSDASQLPYFPITLGSNVINRWIASVFTNFILSLSHTGLHTASSREIFFSSARKWGHVSEQKLDLGDDSSSENRGPN